MKNYISKLLFTLFIFSAISNPLLAYTYKLYDHKENKSYEAQMITYAINDKTYYIGLMSGIRTCIISKNTNTDSKALVGGKCYPISYDGTPQMYSWREYTPNTYNKELNEVINERKQQNLQYKPFEQ